MTFQKPLDADQKEFCELKESAIRLLAPAGSGKTHSLLWRCRRIVHDKPDARIILFTFTRAACDELVSRLTHPEFVSIQSNVVIATINSYGYQRIKQKYPNADLLKDNYAKKKCILNQLAPVWRNYPDIADILADSKQQMKRAETFFKISDALKSLAFRHDRLHTFEQFHSHIEELVQMRMGAKLMEIFNQWADINLIGRDEFNDIEIFLRSHGVTPEIQKKVTDVEKIIFDKYISFWCESTKKLLDENVITLDDQKYVVWIMMDSYLQRKQYIPEKRRYSAIFVDEFQDINPLDLAFLKSFSALNQTNITIVGDDDQAIYEWRGASPAFILAPNKYLNANYKTKILTTNYRSPNNIVCLSKLLIEHNKHRLVKNIKAASSHNAHIEVMSCQNVSQAIEKVVSLVQLHLAQGRRVALVSRKRSQLIPYQIVFAGKNIPFCAAEDLQIFLSEAFNELKEILAICAHVGGQKNYDIDPRRDILLLCNKFGKYKLNKKEESALSSYLLNKNPSNVRDAAAFLREYHGEIYGKNSDASLSEKMFRAIHKLFCAQTVSEALCVLSTEFKGMQADYGKSADDIFYTDPPFLYLSELAEKYGADYSAFISDIEKAIHTLSHFNELSQTGTNEELIWNRKLHLMTALRAKGKEFDVVFVLDSNNDIWPSKLAVTDEELEQERRLFYVAMTRARAFLYFVVNEKILKTTVSPSPYLREMNLL